MIKKDKFAKLNLNHQVNEDKRQKFKFYHKQVAHMMILSITII